MFVIDILRATTTMCAALHHGAKAMIPVATTEEALRLAQTIGSADVLLAGREETACRIPGFHLGNSPLEMTEAAVRGKTLIVTTTNGTRALLAVPGRGGGATRRRRAISRSPARGRARCSRRAATCSMVCAGRDGRLLARRRLLRRAGSSPRRSGRTAPRTRAQRRGASRASTWSAATATAGSARCSYSRAGRELMQLGFRDDVPTRPGWTRIRCWPISTTAG